jgi:hypothetical protein
MYRNSLDKTLEGPMMPPLPDTPTDSHALTTASTNIRRLCKALASTSAHTWRLHVQAPDLTVFKPGR